MSSASDSACGDGNEGISEPPSKNGSSECVVCRQPAMRRCSACKLVFYCGEEHQKNDWGNHKEKCRPYEISQSQVLGRHLKATRDLSPGDLIFTELPLVVGPKPHRITEGPIPCVGCCKLINRDHCSICPECLWPCCSLQCEGLTDNFQHGLECRILKMRPPITEQAQTFYDYFRFDVLIVIRALFLQKTHKNKWTQMMKLQDHMEARGPGSETFNVVGEKADFLHEHYLKPFKNFELEKSVAILDQVSMGLIHKIYAILDVNATEYNGAEILYATASLLEHNCTPNTLHAIDQSECYRVTFRAALTVPKGGHLSSMYTHILWGTSARRQHLRDTKYFSCTCARCRDPTELGTYLSGLKCLGTEQESCGGTQLPVNPIGEKVKWVCDKCRIRLPNGDIMRFVDHLGAEVDKLLSSNESSRSKDNVEANLQKLLKFLHPNHYHIYQLKHTLVQLYSPESDNEELLNKATMCQELIEITKKLDPGNARLGLYLGVLLHEMFEAKFVLLGRNCGDLNVEEVLEIATRNLDVLKFEAATESGGKLMAVAREDLRKVEQWREEHKL